MILPPEAHDLLQVLGLHFTSPTYQRFSALLVGALVTTGRRAVANLLRTLRHLAPGHPTDYRRLLSRAPWSGLALGCALMRFLLDHVVPDGPVRLVGDDTVDGHKDPHVYGKARHRDAVRSSHSYTAFRYGHCRNSTAQPKEITETTVWKAAVAPDPKHPCGAASAEPVAEVAARPLQQT